MTRSIQYKLLGILCLTSLSVIGVAVLFAVSLNRLRTTVDHIAYEEIPKLHTIQQALLALSEANSSLGYARAGNTMEEVERIRQDEAAFNQAILTFDMFMAAFSLGSDSEAFKTVQGGLLFAEWNRQGKDKTLRIPPVHGEEKVIMEKVSQESTVFITASQQAFTRIKKHMRMETPDAQEEKIHLDVIETQIKTVQESKQKINKLIVELIAHTNADVNEEIGNYDRFITLVKKAIVAFSVVNVTTVILFGIFYIRRFILAPIQRLTRVVNDISTGKLDAKIEPSMLSSKDEIGELARAFDRTVVSLKLAMREQTTMKPSTEGTQQST